MNILAGYRLRITRGSAILGAQSLRLMAALTGCHSHGGGAAASRTAARTAGSTGRRCSDRAARTRPTAPPAAATPTAAAASASRASAATAPVRAPASPATPPARPASARSCRPARRPQRQRLPRRPDPSTCGLDGTCDGTGACRNYVLGTDLRSRDLQRRRGRGGRVCDGHGTCTAGPDHHLRALQLRRDRPACVATCASDADCAAGIKCVTGSCGPKPSGAVCTAASIAPRGSAPTASAATSPAPGPASAATWRAARHLLADRRRHRRSARGLHRRRGVELRADRDLRRRRRLRQVRRRDRLPGAVVQRQPAEHRGAPATASAPAGRPACRIATRSAASTAPASTSARPTPTASAATACVNGTCGPKPNGQPARRRRVRQQLLRRRRLLRDACAGRLPQLRAADVARHLPADRRRRRRSARSAPIRGLLLRDRRHLRRRRRLPQVRRRAPCAPPRPARAGIYTPASTCNTTGKCAAPDALACAPYICNGTRCFATCSHQRQLLDRERLHATARAASSPTAPPARPTPSASRRLRAGHLLRHRLRGRLPSRARSPARSGPAPRRRRRARSGGRLQGQGRRVLRHRRQVRRPAPARSTLQGTLLPRRQLPASGTTFTAGSTCDGAGTCVTPPSTSASRSPAAPTPARLPAPPTPTAPRRRSATPAPAASSRTARPARGGTECGAASARRASAAPPPAGRPACPARSPAAPAPARRSPPAAADPPGSAPTQGAASCGTTGFCDGNGACQLYAAGTQCAGAACPAGGTTPTLGAHLRRRGHLQARHHAELRALRLQRDGLRARPAPPTPTARPGNVCNGGSCGLKRLGQPARRRHRVRQRQLRRRRLLLAGQLRHLPGLQRRGPAGIVPAGARPATADPHGGCAADQPALRPTGTCNGAGACRKGAGRHQLRHRRLQRLDRTRRSAPATASATARRRR